MSKTPKRKLPAVGSLVKLKTFSEKVDHIKVEAVDSDDMPMESAVRNFEPGTLAVVTGHTMNFTNGERVPVILVDNFHGWIFPDEWEKIPTRKRI